MDWLTPQNVMLALVTLLQVTNWVVRTDIGGREVKERLGRLEQALSHVADVRMEMAVVKAQLPDVARRLDEVLDRIGLLEQRGRAR